MSTNTLVSANIISDDKKIFQTVNGTESSPYDGFEPGRLSKIEEGKRFVVSLLDKFDCLSYSQVFKALSLYRNPSYENHHFASTCLISLSKTNVLMFQHGYLIANAKSVYNEDIEKAFWVFLRFVEMGETNIKGAWISSGGLSSIYFSRHHGDTDDPTVEDCQIYCVKKGEAFDTTIVFKELAHLGNFENSEDLPVVIFVVESNEDAKQCYKYVPSTYDRKKLLFAVMPDTGFASVESYTYLTSADSSISKPVQFPHVRILSLKGH